MRSGAAASTPGSTPSRPPLPRDPTSAPAWPVSPSHALVLEGECDHLSWQSALDYRHALPRTTVVYLGDAGHDVHEDRSDDVLALIRAFLAGQPLPRPAYPDDRVPPGFRGPP